jgi:outer membrane receptor protein involved in Fe transport
MRFVRFGMFAASLLALRSARADENPPAKPLEVTVDASRQERVDKPGRAASKVERRDLDERLPRSAPDALRYEPGVFVQQTAHGQGSAFIRGRTGQQTIMLFDGIRMNTSLYRQGPNQYFFTLDARTIHHIDVMRGGASTRYGSDAIGGVLDARPIEPYVDLKTKGVVVRPRASSRFATADTDFSHRFQVDAQLWKKLRVLGGFGRRTAGRLESGGPVLSPFTGAIPLVPVFEKDGRTQLGTGFQEITGDARLVYDLSGGRRLVGATYLYRQYDSPRTDQCPPPFAPITDCLKYDEQFRSLAYVALEGPFGSQVRFGRVALSYQRQHERRTFDRPGSFAKNIGRDAVDTFGLTVKMDGKDKRIRDGIVVHFQGGADAYLDLVTSAAWTSFTDVDATVALSRGQYIDGSRYGQGGVFAESEAMVGDRFILRAGGRAAFAAARAPADPISGTAPVSDIWPIAVGHVGAEVRLSNPLSLLVSLDRSYRAPNLDDLTSRQQAGPGFQFENPNLEPEKAVTFEGGLRFSNAALTAEVWGYYAAMDQAIVRSSRSVSDCPDETPQCRSSWSRYQLINAAGTSNITGFEVSAKIRFPLGFDARFSVSYAYGDGPNPQARPADPNLPYAERVPISRVPPFNGTGDVRWALPVGFYAGAGLRWATLQDRLAPTDLTDARIPRGGTPGFVVVDLRTGYRIQRFLAIAIVLENIGDAAYRYHGSSINGPGRGLIFNIEAGL